MSRSASPSFLLTISYDFGINSSNIRKSASDKSNPLTSDAADNATTYPTREPVGSPYSFE